jgi:hypothetical protein
MSESVPQVEKQYTNVRCFANGNTSNKREQGIKTRDKNPL